MKVVIKKAVLEDYNVILKLSILLDNTEKNKKEIIKNAIENKFTWIAKDADKVVGYCLCELFDSTHDQLPNSIFISQLYILEPYRNKGAGKTLLKEVLKTKFPDEYTYFSLSHDPEEILLTNFYKSFGFALKGKTKGGNVKMIRSLES